MAVEQQYAIPLCFSRFDVAKLLVLVGSVEVDKVAVFVCLIVLNQLLILIVSEVLAFNVFQQGIVLSLIVEVLFREHAIVDEQFQVIPLLLKVLTIRLKDRL